jgi:chromosome segregation protein
MRLHQIKLAGFKSFVDPTVISFPSNRVGVVGPNGCGKSNVIDAVRWVMGEKSAKTLRGASMTDVIFNGSGKRKQGDSAEVELVFAQAHLRQYPDCDEIAIKRRVSRNGQSDYFLNGIKCRRKDITAIFMGTGLGPRSYAIIEQGMISRFIEAKPEELRIFLEEAAGISMYKERRRETELRLEHTRENMLRLDDVRTELDKQLERLKRQARAAEKYKQLKEAEDLLRGQLLAMRWQKYSLDLAQQEDIIATQETVLEDTHTRLSELTQMYAEQREQRRAAESAFEEAQARFYTQQAELQRIRQSLEHRLERRAQLEDDLSDTERNLHQARANLSTDEVQYAQVEEELALTQAHWEELSAVTEDAAEALHSAEEHAHHAQEEWEQFIRQMGAPAQRIEVLHTRIHSLEQNMAQKRERRDRLEAENQELDLHRLESELSALELHINELEMRLSAHEDDLAATQENILQQRHDNHLLEQQLSKHKTTAQQISGRLASLEALQEAALGKGDNDLRHWLHARGFHDDIPRLAQVLHVERGWERAVETVLSHYLEALCIEQLGQITQKLDSLPQGKLSFVDAHNATVPQQRLSAPLLRSKISTQWPLDGLLHGIYVAESLAQAYQLRPQLSAHESVITAQGLWLGANWLVINEELDQRAGIFAREQDIQKYRAELETTDSAVIDFSTRLDSGRAHLEHSERRKDEIQTQVNTVRTQLAQLQSQQSGRHARLEQMSVRAKRILAEHAELNEQLRQDEQELCDSIGAQAQAQVELTRLEARKETLNREREDKRIHLEQLRQRWHSARDNQHHCDTRLQTLRANHARLQQALERLHAQVAYLEEKREEFNHALQEHSSEEESQRHYHTLEQEVSAQEAAAKHAKEQLQHLDQHLRCAEEEQRTLETQVNQARTLLEETRLASQANRVRKQSIEELFTQHAYDVEKLLTDLPPEANETTWQQGIQEVEQKVLKLGSINLAALEELEDQVQRKDYLDAQVMDLTQAMQMLTQAIEAIDNETRKRFQDTLDKVNHNFSKMFPRLFGGGEAHLQLNGDDVLSAGITIMARPLGKRNSTIHLLSGGEKALTAMALVFAIFELNPAPFCLLDEVDAPLDDTNVGRFCALVRAMSQHVQFIFISHNKIAMEMAEQLIGVTMQEPGVSRPVTVDLEAAVALVDES